MGHRLDCGVVGYAGGVTYVRVDPSTGPGPYWHYILPALRGKHLALDLADMGASPGSALQDVLLLASMLQRQGARLWLTMVPPEVARRVASQKAVIPGVSCLDFLAPYHCPVCEAGRPTIMPVDEGLHARISEEQVDLGSPPCPSCNSAMRYHDDPDDLFAFLTRLDASPDVERVRAECEDARENAEAGPAAALDAEDSAEVDRNWLRHGVAQLRSGRADKSPVPLRVWVDTVAAVVLLAANVWLGIWLVGVL